MKNKYISTQSNELLTYFNGQNRNCFDYSLAYKALPDSKASAIRELLSDMTFAPDPVVYNLSSQHKFN
ncbi:MAG TPA: hypothetical protein PKI08_07945 [Aquaticitalea sp.]|nr:hypothetical protein [Bacteroidia bacterium]HNU59867.1 hypothetical protein [Aquaticitalea sp.]